jgi:multidrug efflux pump
MRDVNFDWDEPSKVIRLRIDQERARVLGIPRRSWRST